MAALEKWEYTMFQEVFGLVSTNQEALWKHYSNKIQDLGLLGWELVNVVATDYGLGFYFKRRLVTKESDAWPLPNE